MFHIRTMLNAICSQFQILVKLRDGKKTVSRLSQPVKLAKVSDMINCECVSQYNYV